MRCRSFPRGRDRTIAGSRSPRGRVRSIALSPDGTVLLAATDQCTLQVQLLERSSPGKPPRVVSVDEHQLPGDGQLVRTSTKDDTAFLLRTWRITPHTAEPFGACLNIIQPHRRSTRSINGEMPVSETLAVHGTLDPARAQRKVRLRVRQGDWLRWIEVDTQANGAFTFRGSLGEGLGNRALTVQAFFDGDDTLASSMSNVLTLQPPLPLF